MSDDHNDEYYAVEDQRFLGEEGFGEEISREAGEQKQQKRRKPIETDFKEIAKRLDTRTELLRGNDRRWEIPAIEQTRKRVMTNFSFHERSNFSLVWIETKRAIIVATSG